MSRRARSSHHQRRGRSRLNESLASLESCFYKAFSVWHPLETRMFTRQSAMFTRASLTSLCSANCTATVFTQPLEHYRSGVRCHRVRRPRHVPALHHAIDLRCHWLDVLVRHVRVIHRFDGRIRVAVSAHVERSRYITRQKQSFGRLVSGWRAARLDDGRTSRACSGARRGTTDVRATCTACTAA